MMTTAPICSLRRPSNEDRVGPLPAERPLMLVQSWAAPSSRVGDLVAETHEGHVHLWCRWGQDWAAMMDGDADWRHFLACVWPATSDVVAALRCCRPLDAGSAELLETLG